MTDRDFHASAERAMRRVEAIIHSEQHNDEISPNSVALLNDVIRDVFADGELSYSTYLNERLVARMTTAGWTPSPELAEELGDMFQLSRAHISRDKICQLLAAEYSRGRDEERERATAAAVADDRVPGDRVG